MNDPAGGDQPFAASGREGTIARILEELDDIGDPCSVAQGTPMGLHEMGLVRGVELDDDGNALVALRLTSPTCLMIGYFQVEIEKRALQVPGVRAVAVETDRGVDWTPDMMSDAAKHRRREAMLARGMPAAFVDESVPAPVQR